ncbi:hypothetical protein MTP99_000259 [Tenebrio molitor]|nr:hypothetical protein MTP99_000259 [Tenebrio molitor]
MKVFNVTQFWEPNCANGETANIPAMAKPCQIVAEVGRNRNFRHERGRFYSKVSNVAGESPVAPRAFHPLPRSRDICKGRGFDVPMSYGFGQVSGTFLGSGRWSEGGSNGALVALTAPLVGARATADPFSSDASSGFPPRYQ